MQQDDNPHLWRGSPPGLQFSFNFGNQHGVYRESALGQIEQVLEVLGPAGHLGEYRWRAPGCEPIPIARCRMTERASRHVPSTTLAHLGLAIEVLVAVLVRLVMVALVSHVVRVSGSARQMSVMKPNTVPAPSHPSRIFGPCTAGTAAAFVHVGRTNWKSGANSIVTFAPPATACVQAAQVRGTSVLKMLSALVDVKGWRIAETPLKSECRYSSWRSPSLFSSSLFLARS